MPFDSKSKQTEWIDSRFIKHGDRGLQGVDGKERYDDLNSLPAQDLYLIIVGGWPVCYTSGFMYTINKFMKEVEKEGLENFFERIGYYQ
jgi:hypothetical protein